MDQEIRTINAPVEFRKEDDAGIIEGMAAKVNSRANMGWFDEIIEPGAFDDILKDDVRALVNHDANLILARTSSDTLKIWIDKDGNLRYSFKTPNRTYAKDLEDAVKSGDISQSSFAFTIREQAWEFAEEGTKENDLRKIIKLARLYDVSPVTFPAYEDTTVAKRTHEEAKKETEPEEITPPINKYIDGERKRIIQLMELDQGIRPGL